MDDGNIVHRSFELINNRQNSTRRDSARIKDHGRSPADFLNLFKEEFCLSLICVFGKRRNIDCDYTLKAVSINSACVNIAKNLFQLSHSSIKHVFEKGIHSSEMTNSVLRKNFRNISGDSCLSVACIEIDYEMRGCDAAVLMCGAVRTHFRKDGNHFFSSDRSSAKLVFHFNSSFFHINLYQ